MASKGVLVSVLVLRILTLGLLAASVAVMVTNRYTLSDGIKQSFKDVTTYRYVVATSVVGFAYTLFQIPFALYFAIKGKRLTRNNCSPEYDFYGDKVIAFLLATGAGAGFAVTFEFKKQFDDSIKGVNVDLTPFEDDISKNDNFFNKAYIATGLLFFGFISMAVLSVFSSIYRKNSSKSLFG